MGEPQQAPEEKNIDAAAENEDEDSDALDALLTQWLEPSLAAAAAEEYDNDVVVHVQPEPVASANDTEEEEEEEEEAPAAKTLLQVEKDDDVVVAVKTPVVISTLPSGNPSPSAFSTAASAIHENGAQEEEEESETTTLARWMETEIAAPLRFNANLTREMHEYVMHTLAESQRRTEFLIAENNLLRSRQEDRQRLATEFAHQQQQMGARGIETVITQQQQLLMQQHAILRSLKAFAVSFEIGGGQRRHQPPPAL